MKSGHGMDRRDLLKATVGLAAGGLTGGYAFGAPRTLVFNTTGGASGEAVSNAFLSVFSADTGNQVRIVAPPSLAKLKVGVQSKNLDWDLAELVSQEHKLALREGLIQPLDKKIVDTASMLKGTYDDHSVVFTLYSTVLAYNSAKYRTPESRPASWADFWDVKRFPGRRALRNHPVDNLEFALLADGVPPSAIYPIDFARAFRSLDRIKPHIGVWWKDGQQPAQLLVDNEVDFTSAWHGRLYALVLQGETRIGVSWQGGMLKKSWIGVPKTAPNPTEAMKLIATMIRPDTSAKYAEKVGYIGGDPRAFDLISSRAKSWVVTNPEIYQKMVQANEDWWLDHLEEAQARWMDWIVR